MNKLWLLFLLVIPYQLIHAQEVKHAPTVAQCQADQKLWFSKLEQQPLDSGTANVSFMELDAWALEMDDCGSVDPQFANEYYHTLGEARMSQGIRMVHFLGQHNLFHQFIAEDAQGKH